MIPDLKLMAHPVPRKRSALLPPMALKAKIPPASGSVWATLRLRDGTRLICDLEQAAGICWLSENIHVICMYVCISICRTRLSAVNGIIIAMGIGQWTWDVDRSILYSCLAMLHCLFSLLYHTNRYRSCVCFATCAQRFAQCKQRMAFFCSGWSVYGS